MSSAARRVKISSKGQIVIPMAFRRRLNLKTGQSLAVRVGSEDELILRPERRDAAAADEMLRRLRKAAAASGRDLLAEFHERRRRERKIESLKYGRRGP